MGDDVRILEHAPNGFMNVTGVAGDELANLKLVQAAASVNTMADGPIIVVMSQHVNCGHSQTVHSKGQMEHFGVIVDDKSHTTGRKQCIVAPERCAIPIDARDGLPRIDMRISVDAKMDKCSQVFIAADSPWDPLVLDKDFEEEFHDTVTKLPEVKDTAPQCLSQDQCLFTETEVEVTKM